MWKFAVLLALACSVVNGRTIERRNSPTLPPPPPGMAYCPEVECKKRPLELSFVVDASASIWPANFTQGLWFINNFVDTFNIAPKIVRVSVVTYGDRVYTEDAINFEDYTTKESLEEAINNIPYPSGLSTQTGAGINYMLDHQLPQARPGVRKVIIVLTDGNSQEPEVTEAAAQRALNEGLEVFAIGVGHQVSQDELEKIASNEERVFSVKSYHALDDIIESLHFETCGGPATTVGPEPLTLCHQAPSDISFIIDSSQSIGQSNFTEGLAFITDFLEQFDITPDVVRVSAVMYGEGVYGDSAITFDQYIYKADTMDAIEDLEWKHGTRTDTGAGIDYMLEHFLPEMRPHAAHIGIVITDGKSQKWKYTERAAKRARDAGIVMYAVGIGKVGPGGSLDERELNEIAGEASRVLTVEDYRRLNEIKIELMDLTCDGINTSLEAKLRR